MRVGDRVVVSAEATGIGKDMIGIIDKIEKFLGSVLITVSYVSPSATSGYGGTFVSSQISLEQ